MGELSPIYLISVPKPVKYAADFFIGWNIFHGVPIMNEANPPLPVNHNLGWHAAQLEESNLLPIASPDTGVSNSSGGCLSLGRASSTESSPSRGL